MFNVVLKKGPAVRCLLWVVVGLMLQKVMFDLLLLLVLLISVILCGGMITILERKVLGMAHRRVSLNSAG